MEALSNTGLLDSISIDKMQSHLLKNTEWTVIQKDSLLGRCVHTGGRLEAYKNR